MLFKSLKSKIVSSIMIAGSLLIVIIYTSLYFININKSKEFNIHKVENIFKTFSYENDYKKLSYMLTQYAKTDPYVKIIKIKYKTKENEFKGTDKTPENLFEITRKYNGKTFFIQYGFDASSEYVDTLKIRMGVVALGFYFLVFLIARFISSLLTPFNEIVEFFEHYYENKKLLKFKSKIVASEFKYIQTSLNKLLKKANSYKEKIEKLAYCDKVSGLKNRAKFQEDLNDLVGTNFSLFFLDLDGFKLVNDTLGHEAGDQVLLEIGKRLKFLENYNGSVYRLGGDEFVVIVKETKKEYLEKLLRKLQENISADLFVFEEIVNIYASIGVTIVTQYCKKHDILLEADIAMYEAKFSGKNQFKFFEEEMRKKLDNKLALIHEIKTASFNKEFFFEYQPKVKDNKIYGVEALIRWKKNGEILYPGYFIDSLESSKYIIPVGFYLIEEVFKLTKEFPDLKFSINLSEKQLLENSFLKEIFRLVKTTGVIVENIEFEITERWKSIDTEIFYQRLNSLKSIGFSLSIDDFGEDKSSFKRTDTLPISCLKIDRNFVKRLFNGNNSSVRSLKAIHYYCELSGIDLIIEGVETKEEVNLLSEIGINCFQGYYFYKPMSLDTLRKILN